MLLCHFQDFDIEAEWHFLYAEHHLKNSCDEIGDTVKNYVRRESLQRPDTVSISSPTAFFHSVENKFDTIAFDFCSNDS